MLLEIKNISKKFDNEEVLNIPQLSVNDGELLGFVGNNGAGKTTLFRLCLDLLKAENGVVYINDTSIKESKDWEIFTSAFIDERFLIDFLTPEEYFYFIGNLCGIGRTRIDEILDDFNQFMGNEILKQNKCIDKFSKGNKQKIGIIGAMITHPRLLILDEPFNFLDPSSQIIMKNLLQKWNKDFNTTILLSSHNIQYVVDICKRIIILEKGTIIHDEKDFTIEEKLRLENYFQHSS